MYIKEEHGQRKLIDPNIKDSDFRILSEDQIQKLSDGSFRLYRNKFLLIYDCAKFDNSHRNVQEDPQVISTLHYLQNAIGRENRRRKWGWSYK